MRIAFLSYAPVAGGVSTFQSQHIQWLREHGHDVGLVEEVPGPTLERLPEHLPSTLTVERLSLWRSRDETRQPLRRWFDSWQPDVIHLSNPALGLMYARELREARGSGARVVLTQHSEILVPTVRRRLMALGSSVASLAFDEITYVSTYTRRWWERRFPWLRIVQSRVTPNGVPVPLVTGPRIPRSPLRVGFVGRLSSEKGVDRFLDVARCADRRRFAFLAFGDGDARTQLESSSVVEWRGHVEDPAALFTHVDLLLVTSPVENCPFAVLEARAHGVPVVAAAVGGLPELITAGVDGEFAVTREAPDFIVALERALVRYPILSLGCLDSRARWTLRESAWRLWSPYLKSQQRAPDRDSDAAVSPLARRFHASE